MEKQLKDQLAHFINGRVCLLGIGNRYHHDDAVGPYLAEAMESRPDYDVIDAGIIPEDYIETAAHKHPDTIIMVDAADFGGEPGEVRLLYPEHVAYSGVSTEAGSLRMLAEYMQARTHARIGLLAVQPADTSDGKGLSMPVSKTLDDLLDSLPDICGHTISVLSH
ncbi:MAG: hydrogenase maturation protease [Lysobacterales bacterium]